MLVVIAKIKQEQRGRINMEKKEQSEVEGNLQLSTKGMNVGFEKGNSSDIFRTENEI